LYSGVGPNLVHYTIDVNNATLTRGDDVTLPANVQYAWPHPSKRWLYVTSSNREGLDGGDTHHLAAFHINADAGALSACGKPLPLRHRPIHMSLDRSGQYILTAYTDPPGITVHAIHSDGTIGAEVSQNAGLDCGIYPHQVLCAPSNEWAVLVTRGHSAAGGKPEDPGALKVFGFDAGKFSSRASIAPGGGYGFGPRHVDFHPTRPWLYVSLERQSRLQMFQMTKQGLEAQPAYERDTLLEPGNIRPRQLAGTIHVHPNGRFVYVANRADCTVDHQGRQVFGGGENSIVVYAINQETGEPTAIQHIDPRSIHVRTFAFDPSGRVMVAASTKSLAVREGEKVNTVPAALSVFRVSDDGRLSFERRYDIDTGGQLQFWMGVVGLE